MGVIRFPDNFYWGACTASHQIEGNTYNNWSVWEKDRYKKLCDRGKRWYGGPYFDHFRSKIEDPNNYISGVACDHYNRYEQDFDLMQELNLNAYRFSLEWSRIEPEEGVYDQGALQHYIDMVEGLKERGIEPFITLWHWSIPVWLYEQGGWVNSKTPERFASYTEIVGKALGNKVKFWIPLNEPLVFISLAYLLGLWPPAKKNILAFLKAESNLRKGHKKSYRVLKDLSSENMVGIAKHNIHFRRTGFHFLTVRISRFFWNFYLLNNLKDHLDFIGLNFYRTSPTPIRANFSDMKWSLSPEGLYHTLKELESYDKPVFITEHGLADKEDKYRWEYIKESLRSIHRALEEGLDVRGYLHWTLMDNFEWDKGFWPCFGLIEIDRENDLERIVRDSARRYGEVAKNNALKDPQIKPE